MLGGGGGGVGGGRDFGLKGGKGGHVTLRADVIRTQTAGLGNAAGIEPCTRGPVPTFQPEEPEDKLLCRSPPLTLQPDPPSCSPLLTVQLDN